MHGTESFILLKIFISTYKILAVIKNCFLKIKKTRTKQGSMSFVHAGTVLQKMNILKQ